MIDIKTIYDNIVAIQPITSAAPLTPLQEIEERERKRNINFDAPNGPYVGHTLAPSPALITSITPNNIKASTRYDASSSEGFEDGHSVAYTMLAIEYDIAFDNSLYEQVRLIHNNTLVQVQGQILSFSYQRHDTSTIHRNPYVSYSFRITLKLSAISVLPGKEVHASEIGVKPPRNSQCFIATAAFGYRDQGEVEVLRRYRDKVLLPSRMGRRVVDTYEVLSPPIAALIRGSSLLRRLTRTVLRRGVLPIVHRINPY